MTEMGMTESEALLRIKDMEYECMNSTIHYYTDKDIPMLRLSEKALEEIQQYRAIGTIEEFKALKEKSVAKKPIGEYTQCKCSVCGRRVRSGRGSSSFVRDNFCQRCGQAIDWQ